MSQTDIPPHPRRHRLADALGALAYWSVWLLGCVMVLLAALLLSAWLWSGQEQSLPRTLGWLASQLNGRTADPDALIVRDAQGSLREGGRIGYLRWRHDGLEVELEGLQLRWPASLWPDVLLRRELRLDQLDLERLRVIDQRPPQPTPEPPVQLELPWLQSVQLPLRAQAIVVAGKPELALGPLQALYRYGPAGAAGASYLHRLEVSQLRWAEGEYRLQASLQAGGALALDARLEGKVKASVPDGQPQLLSAQASVSGQLGGSDAALQLQAQVDTTPAQAGSAQAGPALRAKATLMPWSRLPLPAAELDMQDIDLAAFWPQAPATRLEGRWSVSSAPASPPTGASHWQLAGEMRNRRAGPWDRHALPLEQLRARLGFDGDRWQLQELKADLSGGRIEAEGRLQLKPAPTEDKSTPLWQRLGQWEGRLQAGISQPKALLGSLALRPFELRASAQAGAAKDAATTGFELDLGPSGAVARDTTTLPAPRLHAQGHWDARTLRIARAELEFLGAVARGHGALPLRESGFEGTLELELPGARSNAEVQARSGAARLAIADAAELKRWLQDSLASVDRLLPRLGLAKLLPAQLLGATVRGQAALQAGWSGPLRPGQAPERWNAQLQLPQWQIELPASSGIPPLQLKNWQTALDGQGGQLTLTQDGEFAAPSLTGNWKLHAQGEIGRDRQGPTAEIRIDEAALQASGPAMSLAARLQTAGGTRLSWRDGSATLAPGQLQLGLSQRSRTTAATPVPGQPMLLSWEASRWSQGMLSSRGQASGLALSWIDALLGNLAAPQGPLAQAGLSGEVLLQAGWDLNLPLQPAAARLPGQAKARVDIRRSSGDLSLLAGDSPSSQRIAIGLDEASLHLELLGSRLQGQLRWLSRNAGQIQADFGTELAPPSATIPQWDWPGKAALAGKLQARLPQIGLWSRLAPPGWRMRGSLQVDATLGGTRNQPEWRGTLQAGELALRSLVDGLDFSDGQLHATLAGETLTIDSLRLRGAGGEGGGLLLGSGSADWTRPPEQAGLATAPREPRIDLHLQAQQLRLFARADRRLTLSGQVDASLRGSVLDLTGKLQADQALILLPDDSKPVLGEDVVVRGQAKPGRAGPASPVQTRVRLDLLLGDNFHLRGLGLDTYLKGQLQLVSKPDQAAPQLTGQVNTVRGSYRAYGQTLEIESGLVSFNGRYDNPSLDILALRPLANQRVGVQVSGSALAPRVRLYADPDLPDSEKLAWLVLGRAATGVGAESVLLQQAALALLLGKGRASDGALHQALGLDELSLQRDNSKADSGSTGATTLKLGKRLSDQFYVSYSHSIIGALGTVAVFYDVSRYLTLRAQAGDDNAIDLIFTHKFD